jgi:hypothetical protein
MVAWFLAGRRCDGGKRGRKKKNGGRTCALVRVWPWGCLRELQIRARALGGWGARIGHGKTEHSREVKSRSKSEDHTLSISGRRNKGPRG